MRLADGPWIMNALAFSFHRGLGELHDLSLLGVAALALGLALHLADGSICSCIQSRGAYVLYLLSDH